MERFCAEFGWANVGGSRMLDLGRAIRQALVETGVPEDAICDLGLSTVRCNDRFFSYRAEKGTCGRHAAVAVMV
ncbi:Multi-copper polyphenol oxidoreductase laccase [Collinsella intestinalis]|nr:Multi-copper polyphenol oxidoreductase laccase [Collinsella intestinalis]